MKIEVLAVIFIIIIIPITIIIGEYASTQIEILKLEQAYDSRLITATHDALKVFQINTFNDETSNIVDRRINIIEASANAFYNALESGFGLEGYSKENLKMYVPALVYTMYDGYYIYSPYRNIADITEGNGQLKIDLQNGNIDYGFKPYVYYSCRYVRGNIDVIINYSLDNYITVQGIIDGEAIYKSGYLLTIANTKNEEGVFYDEIEKKYYYSGIEILPETNLSDYLLDKDSSGNVSPREYKYVKLNGTKYYLNEKDDDDDGVIDEYIFSIDGGNRLTQVKKSINEQEYYRYLNQIQMNTSAESYYRSAYKFTQWVNEKLGTLTPADAQINDDASGKIFENKQIEYPGSNFNIHRKEVIRYSIESNLSVAIANFNSYSNSTNDFQMPKLKENEWELLENEISIISFLQGLNLGGKIYNGYTVVTNDKTEEVVKEERIYINVDENGDGKPDYYHKVNDKHFIKEFSDELGDDDIIEGVLDLDFELRKDGATGYSYTQKKQLACYTSIVGQENVNNKYDSIYEYLQTLDNSDAVLNKTKRLYYSALGRERWGMYKIENPSDLGDLLSNMQPMNNYNIVTDGLIRFFDALNIDGKKNTSITKDGRTSKLMTEWKDLSGHYNGIMMDGVFGDSIPDNGLNANSNGYVNFSGVDHSKNPNDRMSEGDWVNLGQIKDLNNVTLEAVFSLNDNNRGYSPKVNYFLISNKNGDGGVSLYVNKDGKICFSIQVTGGEKQLTLEEITINPNYIYHVFAVYDGNKMSIYLKNISNNGDIKQAHSSNIGISIQNPTEDTVMAIGVDPDGKDGTKTNWGWANIKMYTARIYNKALTDGSEGTVNQIKQNIDGTKIGI